MQSIDLNSKIPSVSRRNPAYIDVDVDKIDLYKFFNFNFGNFIFKLCRRTEISFILYRSKCFVVKKGYLNFIQQPLFHIFLDIGPKNIPQQKMVLLFNWKYYSQRMTLQRRLEVKKNNFFYCQNFGNKNNPQQKKIYFV